MTTRKRNRHIGQDIMEEIINRARRGQRGAEIHKGLKDNPKFEGRELPLLRTIQRVVRDIRRRLTALDEMFQWHNMEGYGLPWEASRYLLDMCAFFAEEGMFPAGPGGGKLFPAENFAMYLPSAREVRWWWRVHQADPKMEMIRVWDLAQAFLARELALVLLDVPLDTKDLEALLVYRPWQDNENSRKYDEAVRNQRVPPIKRLSGDEAGRLHIELLSAGNRRYFVTITAALDLP